MSSELFSLRVLGVTGRVVTVEVKDTGEGTSPPETATFFLTAFHEVGGGKSTALAKEISTDQILDEEFVEANTPAFIERVEVLAAELPTTATYRVTMHDARWCAHLRKGMAWGTASYDIGDPILREALERQGAAPVAPKRGAAKVRGAKAPGAKRPAKRATSKTAGVKRAATNGPKRAAAKAAGAKRKTVERAGGKRATARRAGAKQATSKKAAGAKGAVTKASAAKRATAKAPTKRATSKVTPAKRATSKVSAAGLRRGPAKRGARRRRG